jgi:hypothetical protein
MTGKRCTFHAVSLARQSADAGDAAFLRVATCLEPSINPQKRATSVMIDA